ncbi:hypothetical protein WAK64_21790 [Bacillus spongiae]|uniref:Uncharacterized protein n=1 Tax=Bacillus spongiae TaxID=2683610 RepID=A0ABU8HK44_9BACI
MKRENEIKVNWCPVCNQGWVEIKMDIGEKKMILVCDECDSTWDTPEKMSLNDTNDYRPIEKTRNPTPKEIRDLGWEKYIIKDINDFMRTFPIDS